jgi:hypothetical protein
VPTAFWQIAFVSNLSACLVNVCASTASTALSFQHSHRFTNKEELREGIKRMSKVTGGRFPWHRHTKTYFPILGGSLCTYFFLIACFVTISPEVAFRIALVAWLSGRILLCNRLFQKCV